MYRRFFCEISAGIPAFLKKKSAVNLNSHYKFYDNGGISGTTGDLRKITVNLQKKFRPGSISQLTSWRELHAICRVQLFHCMILFSTNFYMVSSGQASCSHNKKCPLCLEIHIFGMGMLISVVHYVFFSGFLKFWLLQ